MRSRISLDTNRPILQGFFLSRIGRKPIWIYLKYERLPNVCYRCGKLNHETRACKETETGMEKKYGVWLRASDSTEFTPEWSDDPSKMNQLVVEYPPKKLNVRGFTPEMAPVKCAVAMVNEPTSRADYFELHRKKGNDCAQQSGETDVVQKSVSNHKKENVNEELSSIANDIVLTGGERILSFKWKRRGSACDSKRLSGRSGDGSNQ